MISMAILFILLSTLFCQGLSDGHLERLPFQGGEIEWVWQAPSKIDGLLFLAHGCNHNSRDFWGKSSNCLSCVGLPEERKMVDLALHSNYFVFAISSNGRCWDLEYDPERIEVVVSNIRRTHSLENMPLFAIGASSGGAMVSRLPLFMPNVAAVTIQISTTPANALLRKSSYPPSLWICMEKDLHTLASVRKTTHVLKTRGHVADVIVAPSLRINPHFFSTRIPNFSPEDPHAVSEQIYSRFKNAGLLDENGFLVEDPRGTNWRDYLQDMSSLPYGDSLVADESPISEELNVAFADHELTADYMKETINFFLAANP